MHREDDTVKERRRASNHGMPCPFNSPRKGKTNPQDRSFSSVLLSLAGGPTVGDVALHQPFAGFDHLHDVDELLQGHDGSGNAGNDPRPEAIDLVGASQLQRPGAPRVVGALHGLEQGWGEHRRRERQEVEADEENFVGSAADEQHSLGIGQHRECRFNRVFHAVERTLLW